MDLRADARRRGLWQSLERDVEPSARREAGFVTARGALDDYGVVITNASVDHDATTLERSKRSKALSDVGQAELFEFGEERRAWESVFDQSFMAEVAEVLATIPPSARQGVRQSMFASVRAAIRPGVPFDRAALRAARPAVEAALAGAVNKTCKAAE